jgi:hypothetical protein
MRGVVDFCNVLSKAQIEEMAMSDEYEVVKEVQVRLPPALILRSFV